MTERPILFSAPMVRALLDGRKTQTRRIVKPQPHIEKVRGRGSVWMWPLSGHSATSDLEAFVARCPYGVPGDLLWVRENFRLELGAGKPAGAEGHRVHYEADERPDPEREWGPQHPSIHLPRWASRITLRITDARVERLNDISPADALAEGVYPNEQPPAEMARTYGEAMPVHLYGGLWEHINGPGSWDANPWVWVVCFEVVR